MENINHQEDILSLMQRWAPVLYFHPDEKYFPSSVEFYLQNVQLIDDRTEHRLVISPPINPHIIREYSDGTMHLNKNYCLNIPEGNEDAVNLIRSGERLKGGGLNTECTSPVYCHLLRINPAVCDLQYWFFYPYDDPVGGFDSAAGSHEGDWEHVSVRLNWPDSHAEERNQTDLMDQSAFHAIYGSAHSGEGQWNASPQWVNDQDDISRAAIYVAQGTHANYSTLGDNGTINRAWSDDYVSESGAYWITSNKVVPIAWSDSLPDDLAWLGFNGRWGHTLPKIGVTSPSGPAMKSQFTKGDPSNQMVPK